MYAPLFQSGVAWSGALSQLKKLDEILIERIGEIRKGYREEYNFTKYEIDPKLRDIEEW